MWQVLSLLHFRPPPVLTVKATEVSLVLILGPTDCTLPSSLFNWRHLLDGTAKCSDFSDLLIWWRDRYNENILHIVNTWHLHICALLLSTYTSSHFHAFLFMDRFVFTVLGNKIPYVGKPGLLAGNRCKHRDKPLLSVLCHPQKFLLT